MWKWKNQHGSTILTQLRRLGASLDWSREVKFAEPTFVGQMLWKIDNVIINYILPVFCSVLQWTSKDQKLSLRALYGYTRKGLSIGLLSLLCSLRL